MRSRSSRSRAWQFWIVQQFSGARGRAIEFDGLIHKSIGWANKLVLKDAQQAVPSGDDV
jgi:hypothetical protein